MAPERRIVVIIMKKNKVYLSIYYSYFIIFLIVFSLFAGMIAHYYFSLNEEKIRTDKNDFIYHYTTMETKIGSFAKIFELLCQNESVEEYISGNEKGMYLQQKRIIQDVNRLAGVMSESSMLYLIDLNDGICFERRGSKHLSDFLQETNFGEYTPTDIIEKMETGGPGYVYVPETETLFVIDTHSYVDKKKLVCMLECSAQKDFLMPDSKGEFILVDKNDFEGKIDSKILSAVREAEISYSVQTVQDSNSRIYIYPSKYIDGLLYVQQNNTPFVIWEWLILLCFIAVCVLCCIGGRKLIRRLAVKTYMPIDSVMQLFSEEGIGGIDELSDSVKKVIRENEIMNSKLAISQKSLKRSYLKDLLHGLTCMDMNELNSNFGITFPFKKCRVVYLECGCRDENTEKNIWGSYFFEEAIGQMLVKLLGGEFIQLQNDKYALIMSAEKEQIKNEFVGKLLQVIEAAEKNYGVYLFVVVGKTVANISSISESYQSVLDVLEHRFSYEKQSVVCYDDIEFKKQELYYPVEVESDLVNDVLHGYREKADRTLEMIIEENLRKRSLNMQNLTELKFALTSTIKRIIRNMGETAENLFGEGSLVYLEISAATSTDELKNNVLKIFEVLNEYVSLKSKNQQNRITKSVVEYIRKNFDKDISLETVSEHLYISQGHINKIMRKDMNKSFKEYLDEVRITEAKRLLTETAMPVNKISESVGYLNANSFIRLFKRYTDISPGEYRKNCLSLPKGTDGNEQAQ